MRGVLGRGGVPWVSRQLLAERAGVVTPNKRQFIEQLARRFPAYLGELTGRQIASLAQSPGPTALWHLNGMVDGRPRTFPMPGQHPVVRTTRGASRFTDPAHPEYIDSVVVEAGPLDGLTTTQLADYAAMRTFTGADPARLPDRSLSTILTLLDAPMGSEVPITLTSWDLAFLQSLYASNVNIHAPGQRGEIQAGMRRALERASNGEEPH